MGHTRHHTLEVGLNACGVEMCPHASHRSLCAVASYLHRPGDEDEPQSRVGELYLYSLAPSSDDDAAADDDDGETDAGDGSKPGFTNTPTEWRFTPCAETRHTRAIFELKWAPALTGIHRAPALAQADAGGFVSIYEIHPLVEGDEGGTSFELVEVASVQCGGGGLGMATCVDWSPLISDGEDDSIDYFRSSRLAVVGADGGARLLARRESGELEVSDERESAHDLEAWAVAWAHPKSVLGGDFIFTGADDAAFKGWDLRGGLDASSPAFVNRRAHGAGVTCISPSPHDPNVVATGSYDDRVRLWDARMFVRQVEMCDAMDVGGGAWRLRWHPERRALACAAMGGGVVIVEWSGCEGLGGGSGKVGDESSDEGADASVLPEIDSGTLRTVCAYDGHGSIAYGADWGWKRGGKEDVVVSCSFYDKGLHVWSPE